MEIKFLDPQTAPVAGYGSVSHYRIPVSYGYKKHGFKDHYRLKVSDANYRMVLEVIDVPAFSYEEQGMAGRTNRVRFNVMVDGRLGIYHENNIYFGDGSVTHCHGRRLDAEDPYPRYGEFFDRAGDEEEEIEYDSFDDDYDPSEPLLGEEGFKG